MLKLSGKINKYFSVEAGLNLRASMFSFQPWERHILHLLLLTTYSSTFTSTSWKKRVAFWVECRWETQCCVHGLCYRGNFWVDVSRHGKTVFSFSFCFSDAACSRPEVLSAASRESGVCPRPPLRVRNLDPLRRATARRPWRIPSSCPVPTGLFDVLTQERSHNRTSHKCSQMPLSTPLSTYHYIIL